MQSQNDPPALQGPPWPPGVLEAAKRLVIWAAERRAQRKALLEASQAKPADESTWAQGSEHAPYE